MQNVSAQAVSGFGPRVFWAQGNVGSEEHGPGGNSSILTGLGLGLNAPRYARESKRDENQMAFMTSSREEQKQIETLITDLQRVHKSSTKALITEI